MNAEIGSVFLKTSCSKHSCTSVGRKPSTMSEAATGNEHFEEHWESSYLTFTKGTRKPWTMAQTGLTVSDWRRDWLSYGRASWWRVSRSALWHLWPPEPGRHAARTAAWWSRTGLRTAWSPCCWSPQGDLQDGGQGGRTEVTTTTRTGGQFRCQTLRMKAPLLLGHHSSVSVTSFSLLLLLQLWKVSEIYIKTCNSIKNCALWLTFGISTFYDND